MQQELAFLRAGQTTMPGETFTFDELDPAEVQRLRAALGNVLEAKSLVEKNIAAGTLRNSLLVVLGGAIEILQTTLE